MDGPELSHTERLSVLDRDARAIFQKYGVRPDVHDETSLLVRYELAKQIDQGMLTQEDAVRRLRFYDTEITRLREQQEAVRAARALDALGVINSLQASRGC